LGGAVVLEGVADPAVTGAGVQGGRDAGGGADRDVSGLGAELDGAAHGLDDPDVAPCGGDLGGAGESADLDVAVGRGDADPRGLVDLDLAVRAVEGDVAEAADAAELGGGAVGPTREPAGSWTVTSTDPDPDSWFLGAGTAIRRTPSVQVTSVRSAVWTSRLLEESAGRTSTVVSARSAAVNWTRPAGMVRTAEIGAGVSNFCMVLSCARSCFQHWKRYVAFVSVTTDVLHRLGEQAGRRQ
jgi:hypothetical protein